MRIFTNQSFGLVKTGWIGWLPFLLSSDIRFSRAALYPMETFGKPKNWILLCYLNLNTK